MEFRGQSEQRPRRARSRRILACSMRQAQAGLALLVRGSSRRITIMRFRPANIRLINRRQSCPDRCSPCPRTTSTATANPRAHPCYLTRSLHIRAKSNSAFIHHPAGTDNGRAKVSLRLNMTNSLSDNLTNKKPSRCGACEACGPCVTPGARSN
jgi:hypothetical protein